ncbi:MAG: DUF6377 domain-containing protein [Muribaculaceae bacterium]
MCLSLLAATARATTLSLEDEFQRLDSVVELADTYILQKQSEINNIKRGLATAITAQERYIIYDHLFDTYLKFDADSAMHYAFLCEQEAEKIGTREAVVMTDIRFASIFILRSDIFVARDILSNIDDIADLPAAARTDCAIAHIEFCLRANPALHNVKDSINIEPTLVWKKYGPYLPEDSWLKVYYDCSLLNTNRKADLIKELNHTYQPSIKAAMLESVLANCYDSLGDKENRMRHLIRSAINDIMSANREAQSLISIIQSGYIDPCSKRAFNYTLLCTENAKVYKDAGRSLDVVNAHASITKRYEETLSNRAMQLSLLVALLSVGLAIIGILCYVIYRKRRSQHELIRKISRINSELEQKNRQGEAMRLQLKESNEKLKAEIDLRNSHFVNVYLMITKYVAAMKDFKKEVYNQITAGKYDRARNSLTSNELTDNYLKTFYKQFDSAFLLAYPDFIERFNSLLKEEKQIWPTEEGRLTPELRIYALVCIGITDSTRIAEFLQYSLQTIYNYRLRVRHSARIPEKEFASTVAHLYDQAQ